MVSVIIPTKNSAGTLRRCLDSVKKQTFRDLEVIVTDHYSRDDTIRIAMEYGAIILTAPQTERSEQVNQAAKIARGKYLYEIGSDFELVEPTLIQEAVDVCETKGLEVVTIHNTSDPSISTLAEIRNLERNCYRDDDTHVAARFFTKKAFQRAGGFSENMIAGEDYDLHHRLQAAGYFVGRIRAHEVHLGEYRTWTELVRKHVFYGRDIRNFLQSNHKKDRWAVFPIRWIYLKHYRDFLKDAKLTMGFVLYTYVRFASAFIGYISTRF